MKQLRPHQLNACIAMASATKGIVCLPTGTGKSMIVSQFIVESVKASKQPDVYVIMAPRILLANQLLKGCQEDLVANGTDVQLLILHSGRDLDTKDMEFVTYRDIKSTISYKVVASEYERAQREKVSLVIFATYDSADRIVEAKIPVRVTFCDEAHHLVTNEFQHLANGAFPSQQKYFFTATLRETAGVDGQGMNNDKRFGTVIYLKTPAEMVQAGEIVGPRMHIVTTTGIISDEDSVDGAAIVDAFREHVSLINTGGKLLITTKGTEHLNRLIGHDALKNLPKIRPNLKVYDISSEYGPRINGVSVTRDVFLSTLRSLKDSDEAIVFHIDILTEGIDVSGFTGVMPLNGLGKAKFLQTLGRATRLHPNDRVRLHGGELDSHDPKVTAMMTKPFAWVIVPAYGELGEDLKATIRGRIEEMRDFGFNPSEDVFIKQNRGKPEQVAIAGVNVPNTKAKGLLDFMGNIVHDIEDEKYAKSIYDAVDKAITVEDAFAIV